MRAYKGEQICNICRKEEKRNKQKKEERREPFKRKEQTYVHGILVRKQKEEEGGCTNIVGRVEVGGGKGQEFEKRKGELENETEEQEGKIELEKMRDRAAER